MLVGAFLPWVTLRGWFGIEGTVTGISNVVEANGAAADQLTDWWRSGWVVAACGATVVIAAWTMLTHKDLTAGFGSRLLAAVVTFTIGVVTVLRHGLTPTFADVGVSASYSYGFYITILGAIITAVATFHWAD